MSMSKSQITDILILGLISGIVALLTSVLGVSGTIIGSVISSILAEMLKRYLKDPVTDKISEYEKEQSNTGYDNYGYENNQYRNEAYIQDNFTYKNKPVPKSDSSRITSKELFIFPLVVILIIEMIHLLSRVNLIPVNIFYSLESITNWTLIRTIGYALVIMGFYPLISKSIESKHGVLLIIVGIIELIFGYADTSSSAAFIYTFISSLSDYINIAIIIIILYTVLTIPEKKTTVQTRGYRTYNDDTERVEKFHNKREYHPRQYHDNNYKFKQNKKRKTGVQNRKDSIDKYEDDDDDYYYYY